jgi:hypothetical protein
MSLIFLLLKNLPEILAVWKELKTLIENEENIEKTKKLKDEYFETLKACKTSGNTDALRDFIGRVRSQTN